MDIEYLLAFVHGGKQPQKYQLSFYEDLWVISEKKDLVTLIAANGQDIQNSTQRKDALGEAHQLKDKTLGVGKSFYLEATRSSYYHHHHPPHKGESPYGVKGTIVYLVFYIL